MLCEYVAVITRRKPLKRSTKPLKRSPIKRGTTRLKRTSIAKFSPRTLERRERDRQWSEQVRLAFSGSCFMASVSCDTHRLDPHHIYGKQASPKLRHVLENGCLLCAWHHRIAHSHPKMFQNMIEQKFPGRLQALKELEKGLV